MNSFARNLTCLGDDTIDDLEELFDGLAVRRKANALAAAERRRRARAETRAA